MIPDPSHPHGYPAPDNVVAFPPRPAPPTQQPPWPGSQLDEGQLLVNALLALWWGYGWSPSVAPDAIAPAPTDRRTAWMGFDPARRWPEWGIPAAVLALLAFLVGSALVIFPLVAAGIRDEGILTLAGLPGAWICVVGALVFISRIRGQGRLSLDFGFRMRWVDLAIGLGLAIATMILSTLVRFAVATMFDAPMTSNSQEIFKGQDGRVGVVLLALMAAIGAPIVEELLFRGIVLRACSKRLGIVAGVAISSLVFGLLHWQGGALGSSLSLVAGITTYGITFALAARWTGRLGAPIVAHMLLNSLAATVMVYEVFTGSKLA